MGGVKGRVLHGQMHAKHQDRFAIKENEGTRQRTNPVVQDQLKEVPLVLMWSGKAMLLLFRGL